MATGYEEEQEKCPICNDIMSPRPKEIARKRASKTAHELAARKAWEGLEGLEWEEVYAMFFIKIYRHEYKRNLALENEIFLEASLNRHEDSKDICDYHCENYEFREMEWHKGSKERQEKEYAESKWPNPLSHYASKLACP